MIAQVAEKIIGSWDDSTLVYLFKDQNNTLNNFDKLVRNVLSPFLKWDSFYFIHIAEQGYEHEKIFAFYPLLPVVMNSLGGFLNFINPRTAHLLVGFIFGNISNFVAFLMIYKITVHIFENKSFANAVAFAYSISPASIFTLSIYTEPIFTALTFCGIYLLFVKHNSILATICFFLSAGCRSNGLINAFLIFYHAWAKCFSFFYQKKKKKKTPKYLFIKNIIMGLFTLGIGAIECFCIAFPSVMYEEYAYKKFCVPVNDCPQLIQRFTAYSNTPSSSSSSITSSISSDCSVIIFHPPSFLHRIFRRYLVLFNVWSVVSSHLPPWLVGGSFSLNITQENRNNEFREDANGTIIPLQINNITHSYEGVIYNKEWCDFSSGITTPGKENDSVGMVVVGGKSKSGGSVYGYVQKKYWNIGFFNYFNLKQLGQHVLSFPIIILSFSAVISFWKEKFKGSKIKHTYPSNDSRIIPFVLHLTFSLLVIPIIHIQVLTRFLNSSPVIWWYFGYIFERGIVNRRKFSDSFCSALLFIYCVGYAITGCLLFPMFMNWT